MADTYSVLTGPYHEFVGLPADCCVCSKEFKHGEWVAVRRDSGHVVHAPGCTFVLPHCSGGRHKHEVQ